MEETRLYKYVDKVPAPELRSDVETERRDNADITELAQEYAEHDLPSDETRDAPGETRRRVEVEPPLVASTGIPRNVGFALVCVALCIVMAIVLVFRAKLPDSEPPENSLARQAAMAQATYKHQVIHRPELAGSEQAALTAKLSNGLNAPLRVPSLTAAGYRLIGGRLLTTASVNREPVALLIYDDEQGRRLSLLVQPDARKQALAFRFLEQASGRVFYWIDSPFAYALAGELSRDELQVMAKLVYQQINR